jgi:hypothetical protein
MRTLACAMRSSGRWDHSLAFADLGRGPVQLSVAADADARESIAAQLGLEAMASLTAELTVRPWRDGARISGRIEAVVTRICGLSLDPYDEAISEAVSLRIVPRGSANAPDPGGRELTLDPLAEDPPEEASGAAIELSDLVVEHLALALDPFPREPGAVFDPPPADPGDSPFAVLANLKGRPSPP